MINPLSIELNLSSLYVTESPRDRVNHCERYVQLNCFTYANVIDDDDIATINVTWTRTFVILMRLFKQPPLRSSEIMVIDAGELTY